MLSAVYEGTLSHRRRHPDHGFTMRLAIPLLADHEVDEVVGRHPLWSRERVNAVSYRRRDLLGDPEVDLSDAVHGVVETATGCRPSGPVATLAHVRTWGWLFNPLAVHYCLDGDGTVTDAVLAVTNTPWKERHSYVLDGPGNHEVDKAMHVSPFHGMDQRYRIDLTAPGDTLRVGIDVTERDASGDDRVVFGARLDLRRREIDRATLGRLLWRYPLLTARVSAGIHTHALRLWRKGATVHPHPPTRTPEVTRALPIDPARRDEDAA